MRALKKEQWLGPQKCWGPQKKNSKKSPGLPPKKRIFACSTRIFVLQKFVPVLQMHIFAFSSRIFTRQQYVWALWAEKRPHHLGTSPGKDTARLCWPGFLLGLRALSSRRDDAEGAWFQKCIVVLYLGSTLNGVRMLACAPKPQLDVP